MNCGLMTQEYAKKHPKLQRKQYSGVLSVKMSKLVTTKLMDLAVKNAEVALLQ